MLNTILNGLKEKEFASIEKISWDISNRIRCNSRDDLMSSTICISYLAYIAIDNNITDAKALIEYTEQTLSEQCTLFIKECIQDYWTLAIEISNEYSKESLAAVVLWLQTTNRYNAEHETPESIVKLANTILQPKEERVADFCCGTGAFLTETAMTNPDCEFWGMEISTYSKEIAEIRLSLITDKADIQQGSIFSLDKDEKFDKIFCDFPWNMRTKNAWVEKEKLVELEEIIPDLKRATVADWLFVTSVISHLKENGKAVVVATNGTTWNGGVSKTIRERFLKLGYVEAVISLPENLYVTTSIPTSLLVLSKGNHSVRMIDASGMADVGRRQNILSDETILKISELLNMDSEASVCVTLEEIEKNDYAINPSRFLENEIEVENGVPFEDLIINITRGAQVKASELDELVSVTPTEYQYLMLANIQDGIINDELPYLKELDKKLEKYCVKNNSLVISKNGAPVKVAVATVDEGKKILANGNLYVIELDQTRVNPYFVKAYLESENGTVALSRVTVGATMPNIPVDGLKKILIPLPSMEVQRSMEIQSRIAEKYQAKMDEIKVLRYRLSKATEELKNIYEEG